MKQSNLEQCLAMLDKIHEDQKIILQQQQRLISELTDVKNMQKRMQRDIDGESPAKELLISRSGLVH